MDRRIAAMRHELSGFLLRSLNAELCIALLCPEMTHEQDLKQPAL